MDCTNVLKYLNQFEHDKRPTLTHVAVKALAEMIKASKNQLCGKLVFDKFIPFDSIAVSVLIDIGGGEDLAAITIDKVDEMKISDIADYIKNKGKVIKKNSGDLEHKNRMKSAILMPPFLLRILLSISEFINYNLGISIKPLSIKRH